jgi:hypothetical protein
MRIIALLRSDVVSIVNYPTVYASWRARTQAKTWHASSSGQSGRGVGRNAERVRTQRLLVLEQCTLRAQVALRHKSFGGISELLIRLLQNTHRGDAKFLPASYNCTQSQVEGEEERHLRRKR